MERRCGWSWVLLVGLVLAGCGGGADADGVAVVPLGRLTAAESEGLPVAVCTGEPVVLEVELPAAPSEVAGLYVWEEEVLRHGWVYYRDRTGAEPVLRSPALAFGPGAYRVEAVQWDLPGSRFVCPVVVSDCP